MGCMLLLVLMLEGQADAKDVTQCHILELEKELEKTIIVERKQEGETYRARKVKYPKRK